MDACRICLDERSPLLLAPCGCAAYVHAECLERWRRVRKRDKCEVCHRSDSLVHYVVTEGPPRRQIAVAIIVMRGNVCNPLHLYIEANLQDVR